MAPDGLHDRSVRDLPALLRRGDLLVFNDTKVIPARLKGLRRGGPGRQDVAIEALLIRDQGDDYIFLIAASQTHDDTKLGAAMQEVVRQFQDKFGLDITKLGILPEQGFVLRIGQ